MRTTTSGCRERTVEVEHLGGLRPESAAEQSVLKILLSPCAPSLSRADEGNAPERDILLQSRFGWPGPVRSKRRLPSTPDPLQNPTAPQHRKNRQDGKRRRIRTVPRNCTRRLQNRVASVGTPLAVEILSLKLNRVIRSTHQPRGADGRCGIASCRLSATTSNDTDSKERVARVVR